MEIVSLDFTFFWNIDHFVIKINDKIYTKGQCFMGHQASYNFFPTEH